MKSNFVKYLFRDMNYRKKRSYTIFLSYGRISNIIVSSLQINENLNKAIGKLHLQRKPSDYYQSAGIAEL